MSYKLKPNMADFEMVDGPFTGRKFEAGKTYEDVPVTEAHRFISTGHKAREAGPMKREAQSTEAGKPFSYPTTAKKSGGK
jgi:hypothetical protein